MVILKHLKQNNKYKHLIYLGIVAHTYNHQHLEAESGEWEFEASLGCIARFYLKQQQNFEFVLEMAVRRHSV